MSQAELSAGERTLVIVGLYVANGRLHDTAVPATLLRVADSIRARRASDELSLVIVVSRSQRLVPAQAQSVSADMQLGIVQIDNTKLAATESALIVSALRDPRPPSASRRPDTSPTRPLSSLPLTFSPQPHISPSWKPSPPTQLALSDPTIPRLALDRARAVVSDTSALRIADFDDHLEDVGADWLVNAHIVV